MKQQSHDAEQWWTVVEVAAMLKLRRETVRRLIHIRQLRAKKFGRVWRVPNSALHALARG